MYLRSRVSCLEVTLQRSAPLSIFWSSPDSLPLLFFQFEKLKLGRDEERHFNVVENWNSANSFIFYGRGSEISTNDRQSQKISALALHLLQVCLVYVNTLMIQQILARPDWQNRMEIEDLRVLSPLLYAHVNPYGRFELNTNTRLWLD